jgi:hypothetical protein
MNKTLGTTNFDFLASVDSGNGGTNAVSVKGDGTCLTDFYSMSARVAINPQEFDGLGSLMLKTDTYQWNGHSYVFGDEVSYYRRHIIERGMGVGRYGTDVHQFFVAAALLNMGVAGDVDLTLFLPPSRFNEQKEALKASFMGKTVSIGVQTAKGTEYESTITYKNVRVLPEGLGPVFCNIYKRDGSLDGSLESYLANESAVIDIGNYTTDAIRIIDGMFDPTLLASSTHEDFGVASVVKDPILDELKQRNRDFSSITDGEIDYAIRNGTYTFKAPNGQVINIQKPFAQRAQILAERIATEIIQRDFRNFEGMNGCFLIGGGGKIVRPYLSEMYRGKIFSLEAMGHVDETEVNAVGGMRFVLHNYFHKKADQ